MTVKSDIVDVLRARADCLDGTDGFSQHPMSMFPDVRRCREELAHEFRQLASELEGISSALDGQPGTGGRGGDGGSGGGPRGGRGGRGGGPGQPGEPGGPAMGEG